MSEIAATNPSPEKNFNAPSARSLRRAIEILGWVAVSILVITGLVAIFDRAGFLISASSMEFTDPIATFNPFDGRYVQFSLSSWAHLITGVIIFILGPLQFMPSIRKKSISLHRWSGRIWLSAGGLAALSGGFIGIFQPFMGIDGQGFNESMATTAFAFYTLFCMGKAYTTIRARNIRAHREWMIRSWALMLAIATERIMLGVLMSTTDIGVPVLFGTTFWMAGVVNVAASEIWINLTRTPGNGHRHWKDLDSKSLYEKTFKENTESLI